MIWQPPPLEHRYGIILGYHVMYEVQNSGHLQNMTVNAFNLTAELQKIQKGRLYDIKVAAFNSVGEGPPSSTIVVRSREGGKQDLIKRYRKQMAQASYSSLDSYTTWEHPQQ